MSVGVVSDDHLTLPAALHDLSFRDLVLVDGSHRRICIRDERVNQGCPLCISVLPFQLETKKLN